MVPAMDLKVFERIVAGGGGTQAALAQALEVEPMTVSGWKKRGVPAERVLDVERVSGVSRHEIRPDIYPVDGGYIAA